MSEILKRPLRYFKLHKLNDVDWLFTLFMFIFLFRVAIPMYTGEDIRNPAPSMLSLLLICAMYAWSPDLIKWLNTNDDKEEEDPSN